MQETFFKLIHTLPQCKITLPYAKIRVSTLETCLSKFEAPQEKGPAVWARNNRFIRHLAYDKKKMAAANVLNMTV